MMLVETIVIGGGPAGAACACGLARRGREVVIVERASGPHHKVCGEFLSVETQSQLRQLGVDPITLGAVTIDQVAVSSATRTAIAELPFRALSLSRYRLDDALLRQAENLGARVKRNVSARSVTPVEHGWTVACDDGLTLHGRYLVLATGKWGMRGLVDARDNSLVGLKMHLRLAPSMCNALTGRVELTLLGDSGYAGLELVEDDIANLCFVLRRAVVARVGSDWLALRDYLAAVAPNLAVRLRDANPLWRKPIAIVCPTGGHLHEENNAMVFRVGDRLAHIPPFTGDGLAIALRSAALAAEHIRQERPPTAYLAAARRLTGKPIRFASTISEIATNRAGRLLLLKAATYTPALIQAIVQRTRIPVHSEIPSR